MCCVQAGYSALSLRAERLCYIPLAFGLLQEGTVCLDDVMLLQKASIAWQGHELGIEQCSGSLWVHMWHRQHVATVQGPHRCGSATTIG